MRANEAGFFRGGIAYGIILMSGAFISGKYPYYKLKLKEDGELFKLLLNTFGGKVLKDTYYLRGKDLKEAVKGFKEYLIYSPGRNKFYRWYKEHSEYFARE